MRSDDSATFWDTAARENAAWYIVKHHCEGPEFFAQGAAETDALLKLHGMEVRRDHTLLEIGCGVGRMTHRLAELAGQVIATDVSAEMLTRARSHLAHLPNVALMRLPGDGTLPCPDALADLVFSYITLQHVPSTQAQLRYLTEAIRLLRPGGQVVIQLRAPGLLACANDWGSHIGHLFQGRRALSRAWRGTRLPLGTLRGLARDDVKVEIRRIGRHRHRHIWFVARRILLAAPRHGQMRTDRAVSPNDQAIGLPDG
jgi:SAM-dependent methyltransferase